MQRLPFEIDVPAGALDANFKAEFEHEVMTAAVLNLLRRQVVSQGRAAQLLRISRAEVFDLMAHSGIPAIDVTGGEPAAETQQVISDAESHGIK